MILNILQNFETISLSELENKAPLLNRKDKKFVIPLDLLNKVLKDCLEEYQILKIENNLIFDYKTNYFDTKDLQLYHWHHNGKANRHKIRERHYVNSGLNFIEVKSKTNKGQTIKHRTEGTDIAKEGLFIENCSGINVDELEKTLGIGYKRITLLHKIKKEKVTLDLDLDFQHNKQSTNLKRICIAEVKTEDAVVNQFWGIMKKHQLRDTSVSKYCMGLFLLSDGIKYNKFKHDYNRILKINTGE